MSKIRVLILSSLFFCIASTVTMLYADVAPEYKKQLEADELQRRAYGFYDLQMNMVSNLQFAVTNTGVLFYDQEKQRGTGIWPRGSTNYYIFGGGIWVGSKKRVYLYEQDTTWLDANDSSKFEVIVHYDRPIYRPDTVWSYLKWDKSKPILVPRSDGNGYDTTYNLIEVDTTIRVHDFTENKLVSISYNSFSARSVMVPGRVEDGDMANPTELTKYRVFFSTDYNEGDGSPRDPESAPAWPIWDSSTDTNDVLKYDRYFGKYIPDETKRTLSDYPKGPAMISGEDIFCTYKDTDLSAYRDYTGAATLKRKGYPQRIQYEQMIYSWDFGDYRDFIFVKYQQQNVNTDTLWNVWLAPLYDVDIAHVNNLVAGAGNDITSFYGMEGKKTTEKPDSAKATKNMAYQYSRGERGEQGRGFGYVGFVFLESPAVIGETPDTNEYTGQIYYHPSDSMNFVRRDSRVIIDSVTGKEKTVYWYPTSEQLGLRTFRNWSSTEDKKTDDEQYDWISNGLRDGPGEPGDKRYMMATGPFHLRPGDTCRTVVGLVLAGTGKGGDADGTEEDLAELVRKVDFAQKVYDENFRAPAPPARAQITEWEPLNNGMIIKWDDEAENSTDSYEKGLAFMGYKIYRARRLNLDTFDVNDVAPSTAYSSGKGPFGWKELQTYQMPMPFIKSMNPLYGPRVTGSGPRAQSFMGIDSMMAVGPAYYIDTTDGIKKIDRNAIVVMRIPVGVNMYLPYNINASLQNVEGMKFGKLTGSGFYDDNLYGNRVTAVINSIDTVNEYYEPWSKFYAKKANEDGINFDNSAIYYSPDKPKNFLVDSVMLCTLHLDQSQAIINPLFYEQKRVRINPGYLDSMYLPNLPFDSTGATMYYDNEVWVIDTSEVLDTAGRPIKVYTRVKIDTLYMLGTEEVTYPTATGTPFVTISAMVQRDTLQWLKDINSYNMTMDSIYSYINKGWVRDMEVANFTPGQPYKTDFSTSEIVRNEVIKPYMAKITNNRTFIDIGDDNEPGNSYGNAMITTNTDITKTEVLFNNVEYHYKVISFDEGDYLQPTPSKMNAGFQGLPNVITTYPSAERAGGKLNFTVIEQDTAKLGGLYGFNLFAIDEQRVSQLFAGDTIEVEFTPSTSVVNTQINTKGGTGSDTTLEYPISVYQLGIQIRNLTKGTLLYETQTSLEPNLGQANSATSYVGYTAYRVGTDTLISNEQGDTNDVGKILSKYQYPTVNTFFTTGDFKTREHPYAYGAERYISPMYGSLGLSFNAAIKQFGGMYRGDSVDMMSTNVTTNVSRLPIKFNNALWRADTVNNFRPLTGIISENEIFYRSFIDTTGDIKIDNHNLNPLYARFDNGPGSYVVEFVEGGLDTLMLQFRVDVDGAVREEQFIARWLKPVIRDEFSYKRAAFDRFDVDSVEIRYSPVIEHMDLPVQPYLNQTKNYMTYPRIFTPSPVNLPIALNVDANEFYRKFNVYAQGYVNGRDMTNNNAGAKFAIDSRLQAEHNNTELQYIGKQGRYYLTAISAKGDTLDFVHNFNIAGAQFVLSYLHRGRRGDGSSSTDARRYSYANPAFEIYPANESNQHLINKGSVIDLSRNYGNDFAVGNKIKLMSWGGVSGFPEKGAKVKFAVSNPHLETVTEDELAQVKVVPNPYVVSHQAQGSPYDSKLYFTKLPPRCTIDIYTASGDQVITIEHDENNNSDGRAGVEVWDILTKNGQRIQSQTLLALIKTPDGATTTTQFSIIVGGFRIID